MKEDAEKAAPAPPKKDRVPLYMFIGGVIGSLCALFGVIFGVPVAQRIMGTDFEIPTKAYGSNSYVIPVNEGRFLICYEDGDSDFLIIDHSKDLNPPVAGGDFSIYPKVEKDACLHIDLLETNDVVIHLLPNATQATGRYRMLNQ